MVISSSKTINLLGAKFIRILKESGVLLEIFRKAAVIVSYEGIPGIYKRLRIKLRERFLGRNYAEWVRRYDTIDDAARVRIRESIVAMAHKPLISLVMPVYDPPIQFLEVAIRSIQNQIYPHWELLCISEDISNNEKVCNLISKYASEDVRIKTSDREFNDRISRDSDSALALVSGEYIALLNHHDMLSEHALFMIAGAINQDPDVGLIYSDEDKINVDGERYSPYFKCEFNYELFLAQNYISHFTIYRHSLLKDIGGFSISANSFNDHNLALKAIEKIRPSQIVHLPYVLYHWQEFEEGTAQLESSNNSASNASRISVAEHLQRCGIEADVLPAPEAPNYNRVRFSLPNTLPLVSIIIPTRDRANLLRMCINSILEKSTYPNFEIIIVDNGSLEQDTMRLFDELPKNRVNVLQNSSPFNFSELNNFGVNQSNGELICLMNNDIEVLTPNWLEEMVSFAVRPDVGCVGAKLWYPNQLLQHGGVITGLGDVAGHFHKKLPYGSPGYFSRAILHQSLSAVTAACLLVRRAIFDEVCGLEESLAVAFNDVDFCMRVREAGYRNVWTPYAEMIHHESVSRGYEDTPEKQARLAKEVQFMKQRWSDKLVRDPSYSPNLTLDTENISYAFPPRVVKVKDFIGN